MRIVFVRHGEPNYEKDCLTPLGRLQAEAAAERLTGEGIEAIYSSPFGRAKETAVIASEQLSVEPVQIIEDMRELRWGSRDGRETFANGHPWSIVDALSASGWDLTSTGWPDHPWFANNTVTEEVFRVARATDSWLASLGYARNGAYYRCERENTRTVALFGHGGSGAAVIARILNLPFPYVCATMHFHLTGITILRLDARAGSQVLPCMELVNDGKHVQHLPSLIP